MRPEVELNESQERQLNAVRRKALKHQEKREYFKEENKYKRNVPLKEEKTSLDRDSGRDFCAAFVGGSHLSGKLLSRRRRRDRGVFRGS